MISYRAIGTKLRKRTLYLLITAQILSVGILNPTLGEARDQREETKSFVESIASLVYEAGWPTATYESCSIKSIKPIKNGFNVSVKLSGKSYYDSDLWFVILLKIQNGRLDGFNIVEHNAPFIPPFTTLEAAGEFLKALFEQDESYEGFRFFVTNDCSSDIKFALKYRKINGDWSTLEWWKIDGNWSGYLSNNDGKYVTTKSSIAYFYAETKDGKQYWGKGAIKVSSGDRRLPMTEVNDKIGDSEITLTCND